MIVEPQRFLFFMPVKSESNFLKSQIFFSRTKLNSFLDDWKLEGIFFQLWCGRKKKMKMLRNRKKEKKHFIEKWPHQPFLLLCLWIWNFVTREQLDVHWAAMDGHNGLGFESWTLVCFVLLSRSADDSRRLEIEN